MKACAKKNKVCAKEIAGVKNIRILVENINEINLLLPFVKFFSMTSGTSMRDKVGLTLVRKSFSCFNFL